MRATLILCDSAQVDPAGKVHLLGAGWSVTQAPVPPQAVVALIRVPWNETNRPHQARLQLEDADGRVVGAPGPDGPQPLAFDQTFEVGRPAGLPEGSDLGHPIVATMAGLPLEPGFHMWRLFLDGETREDWAASFYVRAPG